MSKSNRKMRSRLRAATKTSVNPEQSRKKAKKKGKLAKRDPFDRAIRKSARFGTRCLKEAAAVGVEGSDFEAFRSLCGLENPVPALTAANSPLVTKLVTCAIDQILGLQHSNPKQEFGIVEICHADWCTPLSSPQIDIGIVRKAIWPVCARMAPNFVGFLILDAASRDLTDAAGSAPCNWRVLAICWSEELSANTSSEVAKANLRFPPPMSETNAITFQLLEKGENALREALAPAVQLAPSGWRIRKSVSAENVLSWVRLRSMVDLSKTFFAGGQGKRVKTAAMKEVGDWLHRQRTGVPLIHPEGILQFWSRVSPKIGSSDFALPLVTHHIPRDPLSGRQRDVKQTTKILQTAASK